uniref:MIR domain-containing protein n=1 Tax=Ditylenchus dipsaci TaxID=166011 RepID=A0A915DKR8_9BILA
MIGKIGKLWKVRLHSHDVKYGSGSGQQSVTGMTDSSDVNSHWQILAAPLSRGNQEISCFGKEGEGSDTGDHYKVICSGNVWSEDDQVRFKHMDTGKYLATSGQQYGRPISGQREIVAANSAGHEALWTTAEGIFIKSSSEGHDEL